MRRYLGVAITALAVSLSCVSAAGAAVEVGSDCTANTSEKDLIVSGFEGAGSPFPPAAPTNSPPGYQ